MKHTEQKSQKQPSPIEQFRKARGLSRSELTGFLGGMPRHSLAWAEAGLCSIDDDALTALHVRLQQAGLHHLITQQRDWFRRHHTKGVRP